MSRRQTPGTLYSIAVHWRGSTELPNADFHYIGFGEPSCFRCGWLPPVPDSSALLEEHPKWTVERACRESWRLAGRFLDKAHLVDWCATQDDSPSNILPLCHYPCHIEMPAFGDGQYGLGGRAEAIAWVAAGRDLLPGWQAFTDSAMGEGPDEVARFTRHDMKSMYIWALNRYVAASATVMTR